MRREGPCSEMNSSLPSRSKLGYNLICYILSGSLGCVTQVILVLKVSWLAGTPLEASRRTGAATTCFLSQKTENGKHSNIQTPQPFSTG